MTASQWTHFQDTPDATSRHQWLKNAALVKAVSLVLLILLCVSPAALGCVPIHYRDLHPGSCAARPEGEPGDDAGLQAVHSGEEHAQTHTCMVSVFTQNEPAKTFSFFIIFTYLQLHKCPAP